MTPVPGALSGDDLRSYMLGGDAARPPSRPAVTRLPSKARVGSIGMRLIEGMARSLDGMLTIERQKGTRIAVQFPHLHT